MVKHLPYIYVIFLMFTIYIHDISNVILSVKKRFGQIILILLHHNFYIILLVHVSQFLCKANTAVPLI